VGEEGRLYGSITTQMIEDAVREQLGVDIDRRKIETHGHIKELGAHVVEIAVYRDVKAQLTVNVVPEGAAPEAFVAAGAPTEVVEVEAAESAEAEIADEATAAEASEAEEAEGVEDSEDEIAETLAEDFSDE